MLDRRLCRHRFGHVVDEHVNEVHVATLFAGRNPQPLNG
jgi:hypothetical protein